MAELKADVERQNYIIISQIHADASRLIASNHAYGIYGQAYAQVNLITGEDGINVDTTLALADIESASIDSSGLATAQATYQEAVYESNATASEASTNALLVQKEGIYQVNSTAASALAQNNAITGETLARNTTSTAIAGINAASSLSEAAIRVNQISLVSIADASSVSTEASIRATGTGQQAAIRVSEISRLANNTVLNTNSESVIDVTESGAIAALRAAEELGSALAQVNAIVGESAARVRSSAGTTAAEARVVLGSSLANTRESSTNAAANALETTSTAVILAATSNYQASSRLTAQMYDSDRGYDGAKFGADSQLASDEHKADQNLAGDRYTADRNLQSTMYGALNDFNSRIFVANTKSTADKYGSDQGYQGVVVHEGGDNQRLFIELALAEYYFDLLWPFVTTKVDITTGKGGTPGFQTSLPFVSGRGVYSQSQIQMKANRIYSQGDASAWNDIKRDRDETAGRGFSANTPALVAGASGVLTRMLRDSTSKASDARIQAAQANATRWLEAQQARSDEVLGQNRAYVGVESNVVRRQVGLVEGVSRIVGGLL